MTTAPIYSAPIVVDRCFWHRWPASNSRSPRLRDLLHRCCRRNQVELHFFVSSACAPSFVIPLKCFHSLTSIGALFYSTSRKNINLFVHPSRSFSLSLAFGLSSNHLHAVSVWAKFTYQSINVAGYDEVRFDLMIFQIRIAFVAFTILHFVVTVQALQGLFGDVYSTTILCVSARKRKRTREREGGRDKR